MLEPIMRLFVVLLIFVICRTVPAQDSLTGLHDRIQRSALTLTPKQFEFKNDPIVYWPDIVRMKVIQVVDEGSAIISVGTEYEEDIPVWTWYAGDTKGMVDGQEGKNVGMKAVIESGTKRYKTAIGGTRTLRLLKALTPADIERLFPDAVSLKTKTGETALVQIKEYKSTNVLIKECLSGKQSKFRISKLDKESKAIVKNWKKEFIAKKKANKAKHSK